ncbi:radical SAM protein [Sorangium sp. So ce448]|uniref:B12-binding domain-containing radical SAM protein n=1 Tax=Sorangium sp. So ce448 TaxID=3133314 RepID=UPI003F63F5AC
MSTIDYLLVNVPLTDPTAPYHSIPYLVGAANAAGFLGHRCLDANLEALYFLAHPDQVAKLLRACASVREEIERRPRRTRYDELRYRFALAAVGLEPDAAQRAIEVMRDPVRFYDYPLYQRSTAVIRRLLDALSVNGFPGQFNGLRVDRSGIVNLSRLSDLADPRIIERFVAPFRPYLEGPFVASLKEREFSLVGLSVNYSSQLPFAIWMAREVRRVLPSCMICVGGTEISDVLKYASRRDAIWRLFPTCDAVVGGEGETALVDLLAAAEAGARAPAGRPGILVPRTRGALAMAEAPRARYEDLRALAAPRYDVWDLGRYWSPEPVVLYSPTRGCYWNRCTFCDYGLNTDSPTSPSRERPIDEALDELEGISRLSRIVYFAVDAISPAYLRKLCEGICQRKIPIRWGAELRIERLFRRGLGVDLRSSGCIAISFGYESGSQSVLDRIDKGVSVAEVPAVLRQLSSSGIGCQLMGFIGFPGETKDEARMTFSLLLENRDVWTLAGIGDYVLTSGSIVGKEPSRFGIRQVAAYDGEDIARVLCWRDGDGRLRYPGDLRDAELHALAAQVVSIAGERPFVGGIDSAHSLLYFNRFGPRLVPAGVGDAGAARTASRVMYDTPLAAVDHFISRATLHALHAAARRGGRSFGCEEIERWLAEPSDGAEHEVGRARHWIEIFSDGQVHEPSESELVACSHGGS